MIREEKYLVKNELEPFLIFYEYFLFRTDKIPWLLYRAFNFINILVIYIIFKLGLNSFFRTKIMGQEFLIERKGKGKNFSITRLVREGGQCCVRKYNIPEILDNEFAFYLEYRDNVSRIKLPRMTRKDDYVESSFLKCKSLICLLREKFFSKQDVRDIISCFTEQLDILYNYQKTCLIHGDLTPDNIYITDDIFYVIDYADAEHYLPGFDKYTFIKRILRYRKMDARDLKNYFSAEEIVQFEEHLKRKNEIRLQK